MPRTEVVFYREDDGSVPALEWLDGLGQPKAVAKCRTRIERLGELGHELRRPDADFLRDGIHELRISLSGIQYRLLYFFHGRTAAVLSHGIIKEGRVPPAEIERAIRRGAKFRADPQRHTHRE